MSDEMKILPGNVQQLTTSGKGNDLESYKKLFKALVKPKKKLVPKIEWGWMIENGDIAYGPFNSREDAVEDAQESCRVSMDKVFYGVCRWGDPKSYLISMDEFLDSMNEAAYNDEFGFFEDAIFDFSSPEDAKHAELEFETFLRSWADKWLSSNAWTLDLELDK